MKASRSEITDVVAEQETVPPEIYRRLIQIEHGRKSRLAMELGFCRVILVEFLGLRMSEVRALEEKIRVSSSQTEVDQQLGHLFVKTHFDIAVCAANAQELGLREIGLRPIGEVVLKVHQPGQASVHDFKSLVDDGIQYGSYSDEYFENTDFVFQR